MSRISTTFAQLRNQNRKALIPFVTAGDPDPKTTVPLLHAMVKAGADILELGVPFSDPMADGPVIQRASERALAHRVRLRDVLEMVRIFRQSDEKTPIVLMGYLNPVEVIGYSVFAEAASKSGVDGVLTVDLPPEEASNLVEVLRGADIDPIFLLAPTSTQERITKIVQSASGFVYYVSLKGVTGAASLDMASVANKLTEVRRATNLPIGVGFGVRNADSAAAVAKVADAVVVGSAIVSRIEAAKPQDVISEVSNFVSELRAAIDAVGQIM
ncbi:Tryptophan synthase alpha chain [Gammaproteobacteria bacterium]